MIPVIVEVRVREVISQLRVGDGSCGKTQIHTGLVQCNRVKGGQHADVGQDGCIVLAVAVAVRGDVRDQRNMEAGTPVADGLGIFRNLAAEDFIGVGIAVGDGVEGTGADAAAAPLADVGIDEGLVVVVADGIGAALLCAAAAAAATLLVDRRLAAVVLVHLAGSGAAAHADVLEGTAEAGGLVPLEVRQGNENIRIHDGTADVGLGAIFAVPDRNRYIIGALQTVTDDHLTSGGDGIKAVDIGAVQMLRGIPAAAGVERIAVGEEGDALLLLDKVDHGLRILRTQIGNVAKLTEMHFDGDKAPVHVDAADAGAATEPLELLRERCADVCSKIREKYL